MVSTMGIYSVWGKSKLAFSIPSWCHKASRPRKTLLINKSAWDLQRKESLWLNTFTSFCSEEWTDTLDVFWLWLLEMLSTAGVLWCWTWGQNKIRFSLSTVTYYKPQQQMWFKCNFSKLRATVSSKLIMWRLFAVQRVRKCNAECTIWKPY